MALKLLNALGWLEVNSAGAYCLTAAAKPESLAPRELAAVVGLPLEDCFSLREDCAGVVDWLDRGLRHWHAHEAGRNTPQSGCRNGTTPRWKFETSGKLPTHGRALRCYPINMLGIDLDGAALETTALALGVVPHLLVRGDEDDPARLVADLGSLGIDNSEGTLRWALILPGVKRHAGKTDSKGGRRGQKAAVPDDRAPVGGSRLEVDPGSRARKASGAKVLGLVSDIRRDDVGDFGCGVLIIYEPRVIADAATAGVTTVEPAVSGHSPAATEISASVERCVRKVMRPAEFSGYATDRSLRDLGLDSVDLMELKALLGSELEIALEPTLFFRHPTPRSLCDFLQKRLTPSCEPETAGERDDDALADAILSELVAEIEQISDAEARQLLTER